MQDNYQRLVCGNSLTYQWLLWNLNIRLAHYLCEECKGKWLMIIKYTDFIYSLYNKPNIYIQKFDKKYLVSFMNQNDKDVEHLIITNYQNKYDW